MENSSASSPFCKQPVTVAIPLVAVACANPAAVTYRPRTNETAVRTNNRASLFIFHLLRIHFDEPARKVGCLNSTQCCGLSRNCLIHTHACSRTPIHLLFGDINPMGALIRRQAVHLLLYREIFQLPEVVGIVFLENGGGSAVARHVNRLQSGVELKQY